MMDKEFIPFPKIPRMNRNCVVSEKIDGSNAQILITESGEVFAGSRKRWVTPGNSTDNYGFARWVEDNRDDLLTLPPGRYFGEWYGKGIQRQYGLDEKRFTLFPTAHPIENLPKCISGYAPILYEGIFDTRIINAIVDGLRQSGSFIVPGFDRPEGVVVYHSASKHTYKILCENDEVHKG